MSNQNPQPKEEPVVLTPEQKEMVQEAIRDREAGDKGFTADEALEHARAKVRAWLPNQSAQSDIVLGLLET